MQLFWSQFFQSETPVKVHLEPVITLAMQRVGGSSSNQKLRHKCIYSHKKLYLMQLCWSEFFQSESLLKCRYLQPMRNFGSCNGLEEVLPIRNYGSSAFPANKKRCLMQLFWSQFVQSESLLKCIYSQ